MNAIPVAFLNPESLGGARGYRPRYQWNEGSIDININIDFALARDLALNRALTMEYAWHQHQQRSPQRSRPWYRRWISRSAGNVERTDHESDAILTLHWWGHLTLARLDGKLPAWEGIRLVRERSMSYNRLQG